MHKKRLAVCRCEAFWLCSVEKRSGRESLTTLRKAVLAGACKQYGKVAQPQEGVCSAQMRLASSAALPR